MFPSPPSLFPTLGIKVPTTLPLRTIHNNRRPINLLRIRGAKEGRPGAAIRTQVEIDIDICKHTTKSAVSFPTYVFYEMGDLNQRSKKERNLPAGCEQSGFPSSGHRLLTLTTISLAPGALGVSLQQMPHASLAPEPVEPW